MEVVECCRLADQLGYDSFWLSEGHGGDQFTTLTACALATERIKLGTSIISVFVRSAPTIAMAAACLDHFSQGRFILGLGSSHKVQVEGEHSVPYEKPITRLREYIDVIRTLLRDGEVSYKGSVLDIDRFDFWLPTLHPEVPIYAAAVFDKMLRTWRRNHRRHDSNLDHPLRRSESRPQLWPKGPVPRAETPRT